MKTIEQYEVEISEKSEMIEFHLARFKENTGNIGKVIGKDPTVVYDLLTRRYNETITEFRTTTRRNPEIMAGYVRTFDKILSVLYEVEKSIELIDKGRSGEEIDVSLEVDKIMDWVSKASDDIVPGADIAATEAADFLGIPKGLVIGGATYFLLRFIGLNQMWSVAGGASAGYFLGKEDQA